MTVTDPDVGPAPGPDGGEDGAVTPELERSAERARNRLGFLYALPAYAYLVLFFAAPLVIVGVYSFATRPPSGGVPDLSGWNLDAYSKLAEPLVRTIAWRSFWYAVLTTVLCLLLGYPFALYLVTRPARYRNLLLVLVLIPFWSNFLVRTYAWRVLLGSDGPWSQLTQALGFGESRLLFTPTAVIIGLVYGFLPFMILPLYASIERLDWRLVEASPRPLRQWLAGLPPGDLAAEPTRGHRGLDPGLHPQSRRVRHARDPGWGQDHAARQLHRQPVPVGPRLAVRVRAVVRGDAGHVGGHGRVLPRGRSEPVSGVG